ncbi:MAG: NAD-dependent epimerase/dehydratase family protein [Candidatus Aminicenantes bacterium]|nr:NAD-dependent epimerase/dehydratase family protein [Candidatus Aminicenantes bacterium]
MSKVFVTGANGFVGSAVSRNLAAAGWDVVGLVRPTSDLHLLDGAGIPLIRGDLRDPSSFRIPAGVTHVVHAASVVSDVADAETCRCHIFDLARNLVAAVRASGAHLRRLVFVSTALTLGYGRSNISEEHPGLTADFIPYTRYKILAEGWFLDEYSRRGLPVVILRPSDIMGPGDRTTSGRLFREGEKGMPLIIGHGRHRFGYTYIANLCRAVEAALVREGIEGRSYTVTNGRLPTWGEYLGAVEAGFGKRQRLHVPPWIVFAVARAMEAVHKLRPSYDPKLTVYRIRRVTTETTYDITRTVADLGYDPDDDYLRQVAETLAWYREERAHGHIR